MGDAKFNSSQCDVLRIENGKPRIFLWPIKTSFTVYFKPLIIESPYAFVTENNKHQQFQLRLMTELLTSGNYTKKCLLTMMHFDFFACLFKKTYVLKIVIVFFCWFRMRVQCFPVVYSCNKTSTTLEFVDVKFINQHKTCMLTLRRFGPTSLLEDVFFEGR